MARNRCDRCGLPLPDGRGLGHGAVRVRRPALVEVCGRRTAAPWLLAEGENTFLGHVGTSSALEEEPLLRVDEITWGIGEGAPSLTEKRFGSRRQAPPPLRLVPPRDREPGDDDEEF